MAKLRQIEVLSAGGKALTCKEAGYEGLKADQAKRLKRVSTFMSQTDPI